jgi:ribosomal protein L6, bacterial type
VTIPSGVQVDIDGRQVTVQGPKGTLKHTVADPIDVVREDGVVKVTRPNDEGPVRALHGLSRTLIANMVTGVTDGYRKTLEIVGVGYRVQAKGSNLEFSLGFSHPVTHHPAGRHHLPGRGSDQVRGRGHRQAAGGRVAANIRKLRKPDPYKGKGVRYQGEQIRRKVGKAGK